MEKLKAELTEMQESLDTEKDALKQEAQMQEQRVERSEGTARQLNAQLLEKVCDGEAEPMTVRKKYGQRGCGVTY